MESENLQTARYYLSKGFHPIPLKYKTKKPPLVDWKKYQDTPPTEAELVEWFGVGQRNMALVVGRGILVVDLDGPGAEQLLIDAGAPLPEDAPRAKTANGFHVFLSVTETLNNRAPLLKTKELQPGTKKPVAAVDIRADGGYNVAPPSVHPSNVLYEWITRPDVLPAAPARLIELIKRTGAPATTTAADGDDVYAWVAKSMAGVGEGQRDNTCARLAGYYLGKDMPADVVRATLYAFADNCTPPLPHADVDKTVKSVATREAQRAADNAGSVEAGQVDAVPFQVLGYNQGVYYYLPRGSRQVVELRAKHHTKLDLLTLAPHAYWERGFPGPSGPKWDLAANALIRKCEGVGVYDSTRLRGRGAWWDVDHAVLHLGDTLITNGLATPIMDAPPGAYIYEAAAPMPVKLGTPLSAQDAHKIVQICELATWERPISAKLLAGCIAVAPICGALDWRPHTWLTGGAGTGKTWMMNKVVRRLLSHIALVGQSTTSEAGLRQTLGNDARPIVFDEIEGVNEEAQRRIQNILTLARQASSEGGGAIIKGSPLGIAKSYRIRSAFIFASIGVGLQQHADATRVTVLSLEQVDVKDPENVARFRRLEQLVADTLTDDFVQSFNARIIHMVPVIRANARTFAAAGAQAIGSQRLGDQIGALLAGAYALHNDGLIDTAAAAEWIGAQDWAEQQNINEGGDELACLNKIAESTVRIQSTRGPAERSIGELIASAAEKREDFFSPADAHDALLRVGIRVDRTGDNDQFLVANEHSGIARLLAGTPWSHGWKRILRRVKGAQPSPEAVRFAGVRSRATGIPLGLVCDGIAVKPGQGEIQEIYR